MSACYKSKSFCGCADCNKKKNSGHSSSYSNKPVSSRNSSLSLSRREHLEREADRMAENFISSRSKSAIEKPYSGTGDSRRVTSKMRRSLGDSIGSVKANSVLMKSDEEESALTPVSQGSEKGGGSITETAETNVGSPESALDQNREEGEVLTKLGGNYVKTVSRDGSPELNGGSAMPSSTQKEMGAFFGRDFSSVKIHNDSQSHQYTRSIGALAATKSNHIFFSDKVNPIGDKRLLAHELTHVVQQNRASGLRTKTASHNLKNNNTSSSPVQLKAENSRAPVEISNAPVDWQLYQSRICTGKANEHASTQPLDFPKTYISNINVSIADQKVTLDWTGPSVAEAEKNVLDATGDGIINCSTGAGVRGQTSCNDPAHSQKKGTCCTPIGTFTLGQQSCVTPKLKLQNFSGFQRAGIGLHYYGSVPNHPASHGCVRLHRGSSKIIFDSARTGKTTVTVSGKYKGNYNRYKSCS